MKIKFLPQGIECEIAENQTILEAAVKNGVNIDGNCAGKGTCGKCKVKVISGETAMPEGMHTHYQLSEAEVKGGWVLACASVLKSDAAVEVPETDTTASRKKKLIHLPEGFAADCGEKDALGVAVDIGTTTVVVSFWNLQTGAMLDVDAMTNPQGAYGADVISRISFATENEGGCGILHAKVIGAINTAVDNFCKKNNYENNQVKKYAIVGNTTMSHLFLNIDPSSLAVAPFAPAFTGEVKTDCEKTGLHGSADAQVIVVPNIAGHVGSDITAGIITTDLMEMDTGHLFIDIGTNGEIVLSAKGKITACSTAAGPAFEGSSIKYGMRAAAGAIERVYLDDAGVKISVIGGTKPIGICGSGIIDAVGELIRTGIVDKSGRLLGRERLAKKGISEKLLAHIEESEDSNGNDFVLFRGERPEENVYITQKDVREVQLAKAAISAGISIMMEEIGLAKEEIEKVSVAGAFGNYIRNESAVNMGLLPRVELERIKAIGNSAGVGAAMVLLSRKSEEETVRVSEIVEHIDLAEKKNFQDEYLKGMRF